VKKSKLKAGALNFIWRDWLIDEKELELVKERKAGRPPKAKENKT